ncbi:hypothetical protein FIBSPDRAFT_965946 [Athelia psychrophila]|uniref:DUF6533 domain-containing protein n=1 Tax=Athelia psychrophila TaxID=1759441 RepID=A0A167XCQ1_9AGAM|nr:hypothetical protein FIBSPDRAFT_965946 [Fibularhizoctonia sp. CBS 109695]
MEAPDPSTLPNPYTPLAFLPPEVADQYQILGYVYVGTLAAYSWDWFISIPEEWRVVKKSGMTRPNVVYAISRLGTMGFLISTVVFTVASVSRCQALLYSLGVFFIISLPSTSLLFFIRLRAVFSHSNVVVYFFGLLWVAVLAVSPLYMVHLQASQIPFTARCNIISAEQYSITPLILASLNDTFIFFAISFRLIATSVDAVSFRTGLQAFFRGNGLHSVSKALLQTGQAYYAITIGLALPTIILLLTTSVPPEMHSLLGPSYLALSSAMACRVFRMVILGVFKGNSLSTTFITSAVAKAGSGGTGHASSSASGNTGGRQARFGPYDAGVDTSDIAMKPRPLHSSAQPGPFGVLDFRNIDTLDLPGSDSKGAPLGREYSSDNSERV